MAIQTRPELKPGSSRCLCAECGLFFSGTTGFDVHRIGSPEDRRCMTPAQLEAKGYIQVGGIWKRNAPMPAHWAEG